MSSSGASAPFSVNAVPAASSRRARLCLASARSCSATKFPLKLLRTGGCLRIVSGVGLRFIPIVHRGQRCVIYPGGGPGVTNLTSGALLTTSRVPPAAALRERAAAGRGARPNAALAIMLGAQLMIVLDVTVVNVALPHIQSALHFSATSLSWVANGYTLTAGGLLLLGGRAGDILGRRFMFMVGIAIFTLASLLGGLAASPGLLLAARAVQGVGGALAAPAVLALVVSSFPEGKERTRALAIYMGVITGGSSLGLVLGGTITEWLSWRWVLFINVPIGVAVILLAPVFVAETSRQSGRFDLVGAVTSTAGVSALVYAFIRASSDGWGDKLALAAFAAAAVL